MAAVDGLFIVKQGALITLDGMRTAISPGMTARAGHPVLESYGHLFAPLTVDFDVETEPSGAHAKPPAAPKAAAPKADAPK
jgi:hypothetical protein